MAATDVVPMHLHGGDFDWGSAVLGALGIAAAGAAALRNRFLSSSTASAAAKSPASPVVMDSMPRQAQLEPILDFAAQYLKPLTAVEKEIIEQILPPVTESTKHFWAEVHQRQFGTADVSKAELQEDRESHIHAITTDQNPPHLFVIQTQKLEYVSKTWVDEGNRTASSSQIVAVDGAPLYPMVMSEDEERNVYLYTDERTFYPSKTPQGEPPMCQAGHVATEQRPGRECYTDETDSVEWENLHVELRRDEQVVARSMLSAAPTAFGETVKRWKIENFKAPLLSDILQAGSDGASYSLHVLGPSTDDAQETEVTSVQWTVRAATRSGTSIGEAQQQNYIIFPALPVPISWPIDQEKRVDFVKTEKGSQVPWDRITFAGRIEDATEEALPSTQAPEAVQDMSTLSLGQLWGDEGGVWRWDVQQPWQEVKEGTFAVPPLGWSTQKLAEDYRQANLRSETVLYLHKHLDIQQLLEHVQQCASSNPPARRGVDHQGGDLRGVLRQLQTELTQARNTLAGFWRQEVLDTPGNYRKKYRIIPATRDVNLKMEQAKAEIEALKSALQHAKQTQMQAPPAVPVAPVATPAVPVATPAVPVATPAVPVAPVAAGRQSSRAHQRKVEQRFNSWFQEHPFWSTLKGSAKVPITKSLLLRMFRHSNGTNADLNALPQNEQQMRQHGNSIFPHHPVLYSLEQGGNNHTIKMKYLFNRCTRLVKTLQGRTPTDCMKSRDDIWKLLHSTLQRIFSQELQRDLWLEQLRTSGAIPPVVQYWLHRALKKLDELDITLAFLPVSSGGGTQPVLLAPQTYHGLAQHIVQHDRLLIALENITKANPETQAIHYTKEYLKHPTSSLVELMETIAQRLNTQFRYV